MRNLIPFTLLFPWLLGKLGGPKGSGVLLNPSGQKVSRLELGLNNLSLVSGFIFVA